MQIGDSKLAFGSKITLAVLVAMIAAWVVNTGSAYTLLILAAPITIAIIVRPWLGLIFIMGAGALGKLGEFPDFSIDIMQAIGFITMGSALLLIIKNQLKYRFSPLDFPILLLVLALLVTLPGSGIEVYSPEIFSLLSILGLYFVSVQLLDTQKKVQIALGTFVTISAVIVAMCVVLLIAQTPEVSLAGQSVSFFYFTRYGNIRLGGPFEQPNTLSQLLVMAVPVGLALTLSARGRKRWIVGVMTCLNAAGTFLTQSRSAIVGMMFGVTLLIYFTQETARFRRYTMFGLVALGVIIAIAITGLGEAVLDRLSFESTIMEVGSAEKYMGRTLTFPAAVESFLEQPWGAGYGQSKHLIGERLGVDVRSAHNVLLSWMVEFGILGLVAGLWLIFRQIRSLWQVARNPLSPQWQLTGAGCLGAIAATWIHNMFHATLHWGLVWLFFAIASSVAMLGLQHPRETISDKHRQDSQYAHKEVG